MRKYKQFNFLICLKTASLLATALSIYKKRVQTFIKNSCSQFSIENNFSVIFNNIALRNTFCPHRFLHVGLHQIMLYISRLKTRYSCCFCYLHISQQMRTNVYISCFVYYYNAILAKWVALLYWCAVRWSISLRVFFQLHVTRKTSSFYTFLLKGDGNSASFIPAHYYLPTYSFGTCNNVDPIY